MRHVYADYQRTGRSDRWRSDHSLHVERSQLLARALADAQPSRDPATLRILDIGCGSGSARRDLLAAGVRLDHIVGVDIIPERVAAARANGLGVALASATHLPLAGSAFDVAVCFTVLSSIADDQVLHALREEARRVLRPDGALVVYDMRLPNPANPAVRRIDRRRLARSFPGWRSSGRSCTLVPALARRLAPRPGPVYRALAAVPALRSHRMTVLRPAGSEHTLP